MRALLFSICLALIAGVIAGPARAQTATAAHRAPDIAAQHAAMQRLAPLLGEWEGEANLLGPRAMLVHQTERVEAAMDGLLLVIRGTGFATPERAGAPVFQALAVVSYDDRQGMYEFRSYAMGYATTATGEFMPDGAFRWSINPGGPVRIRYTIIFDQDSFRETGEMSRDAGSTWTPTIEMQLHRAGGRSP